MSSYIELERDAQEPWRLGASSFNPKPQTPNPKPYKCNPHTNTHTHRGRENHSFTTWIMVKSDLANVPKYSALRGTKRVQVFGVRCRM